MTTAKDQDLWVIENDDDMNIPVNACPTMTTKAATRYQTFFLQLRNRMDIVPSSVMQDDSNQALSNFTERHVTHPTLPMHIQHSTSAANDESNVEVLSQQQRILDTVCIADPYCIYLLVGITVQNV